MLARRTVPLVDQRAAGRDHDRRPARPRAHATEPTARCTTSCDDFAVGEVDERRLRRRRRDARHGDLHRRGAADRRRDRRRRRCLRPPAGCRLRRRPGTRRQRRRHGRAACRSRAEAWDDTIEATDLDDGDRDFALGGESENVAGCSFYEATCASPPTGRCSRPAPTTSRSRSQPLADPDATTSCSTAPRDGATTCEFSPDGRDAADVGRRRLVARVGRVDGWDLLGELPRAGGWYSMAFAPDGALAGVRRRPVRSRSSTRRPVPSTRTFGGSRAMLGDMVVHARRSAALRPPADDGAVGVWDVAARRAGRRAPRTHACP